MESAPGEVRVDPNEERPMRRLMLALFLLLATVVGPASAGPDTPM